MQWGPSERMSMFFPVYTATGCCRHKLTKIHNNIIIILKQKWTGNDMVHNSNFWEMEKEKFSIKKRYMWKVPKIIKVIFSCLLT